MNWVLKSPRVLKTSKILTKKPRRNGIIFITYQSGPKLIEASSEVGFVFDLTILDEAHKTVGYRTKSFARLIVDEKYASTRYLFMTATERVLRVRMTTSYRWLIVRTMAN